MAANRYDNENTVRLVATFTSGGSPVDPTTVTLYVRKPDGEIVEQVVSPAVTGTYQHDILADQEGVWKYRFEATGAYTASENKAFYIRNNGVNP